MNGQTLFQKYYWLFTFYDFTNCLSVLTRKRGLLMFGVGTLGGGYPYPGCIIGDGGMP